MKIVILASDEGKKLWPLTSSDTPKSFLPLYSPFSLLVESIFKISALLDFEQDLYIVLPEETKGTFNSNVVALANGNLIYEPYYINDSISMMYATKHLRSVKNIPEEEPILFIPSDLYLMPQEILAFHIDNAVNFCLDHKEDLIFFMKEPFLPSTKQSYCIMDETVSVTQGDIVEVEEDVALHSTFIACNEVVNNPSYSEAERLIDKDCYWVANIYVATLGAWVNIWDNTNDIWGALINNISPSKEKLKKGWRGWFSNIKIPILNRDESKQVYLLIDKKFPNFESTLKLISDNNITRMHGCDLVGMYWAKLDNWAILKHLLCDSGLFEAQPDSELHLIESENNYVFKPLGKQIALFGIKDLVIIDSKECLLIGTPDSIYENL